MTKEHAPDQIPEEERAEITQRVINTWILTHTDTLRLTADGVHQAYIDADKEMHQDEEQNESNNE